MSRSCDGCTACCKILGISELQKPQNTVCQHCDHGCKLYGQSARPKSCVDFKCLWVQELAPEELRPDLVHVVFDVALDGQTLVLHSDTSYLEPWRKPEVWDFIHDLVWKLKIDIILVEGQNQRLMSVNTTAFEIVQPQEKKTVTPS